MMSMMNNLTGDDLNEQVRRASEAHQRYGEYLMRLPHVTGVAVGYTSKHGQRQPEIGLIVMVDEKLPAAQLAEDELVPRELDGVRVDVQQSGIFSAF